MMSFFKRMLAQVKSKNSGPDIEAPRTVHLVGGPWERDLLTDHELEPTLGMPVAESLQMIEPAGSESEAEPFAMALYQREADSPEITFSFRGFQRANGQPLPVEFVDGPASGVRELPSLLLGASFPVDPNNELWMGKGDPAAVANYQLALVDHRWVYRLAGIDDSHDTVSEMLAEVREARIASMIRGFYANPYYDIYTLKPSGEHKQVSVEIGWRRGEIDELIVPIISECWRLGLDTIGSCQSLPESTKTPGKAYVSFPRIGDAKVFHSWLEESGIGTTLVEKKMTLSRGETREAIEETGYEYDSANVVFEPSDFDRIEKLLGTKTPIRE